MATWSAFSIGGLDPIATDWQRSRDRKDAEWSVEQQKDYDAWKSQLDYNYDWLRSAELQPFQYKANLEAQYNNLGLESDVLSGRYAADVAARRHALEASGYNPLLAVDNVAGAMSASPLVGAAYNSAGSHGGAVGRIDRSPAANAGIGSGTPFDWSSAKAALDNTKKTGKLIDAQAAEAEARAEVSRNSAAKIKKETELVGFENPTRSLKSVSDSFSENVDDFEPVNSAETFFDSIKVLTRPSKEQSTFLSRNLIDKLEKAGIDWLSMSNEDALKALKEYNEKKKAR